MGAAKLSFISFLHQTTTGIKLIIITPNCLLSLFYIKPQLPLNRSLFILIVFYLFSTSNHNLVRVKVREDKLSFISFLHQTTTLRSCSSFSMVLSFISFLHQTTTWRTYCIMVRGLSFISFLHQTTTNHPCLKVPLNCLLSLFYIKPQRILCILLIYSHLPYILHMRSGSKRFLALQKY